MTRRNFVPRFQVQLFFFFLAYYFCFFRKGLRSYFCCRGRTFVLSSDEPPFLISSTARTMLSRSPQKGTPKKRERLVPRSSAALQIPSLLRLPTELLHQIFMLVLDFDGTLAPMAVLPLVSYHWSVLLESTVMWEFVCKRHFVCYAIVQRLRTAPVSPDDLDLLQRVSSPVAVAAGPRRRMSSFLTRLLTTKPAMDVEPPTNRSVRIFRREVTRFNERRKFQELVSRRRAFVIHAFLSLALLLFACTLLTAMCTAEGLDPITVCNADVAFSFLWLTYTSILGIVISNIVMEAHFEPRPLLTRLRNHTRLIMTSTAALLLGIFFVVLPTYLVQQNLRDRNRSWLFCAAPVITALQLWQIEVLYVLKRDFCIFMRDPQFTLSAVYHGVTYLTPTMFTGSIVALTKHMDGPPNALLLIIGCLPVGLTFFTLSVVFFLDYTVWHRTSDLVAGASMSISNIFCILVVCLEWRGLLLAPLVAGAFCFFFGHFHELRKMIDAVMSDPDGDQVLFVEND
jgi:hypothetical protein